MITAGTQGRSALPLSTTDELVLPSRFFLASRRAPETFQVRVPVSFFRLPIWAALDGKVRPRCGLVAFSGAAEHGVALPGSDPISFPQNLRGLPALLRFPIRR